MIFRTAISIFIAFTIGISGSIEAHAEKVRAWEGTIEIPTYPWGPDDINPRFEELEGKIIYPYPMQDILSGRKVDRTYKALFLENEYLKATCLPELGGRIHSVFDKTTGEEMFHRNDVIKPGLIGMRGAWISGGIEWNTGPHGHTVTIVSPVNALVTENGDGSATLHVSNTEQIFRTRWNVKLTLEPGRSFLHEEIRIFNPTDGVHPYYFWNCTAFPCLPGTRFIYPMTLGCDHDGREFFKWPVDDGKDLTWLKNYDRPTSVFAYECDFDFFGAYDVDLDRGIVQYADHAVLPGKKAWTWGQSDDGLISQKALTDVDGPYIEVQSGPLLTQADYGLLGPRERVAWEEWWYPVHGMGDGFEYATKDVAVQTHRRTEKGQDSLEIRIISTGAFPNSTIKISAEGQALLDETFDLDPRSAGKFVLKVDSDTPVEIEIKNSDGKSLASFVSSLPIPAVEPPTLPEEKPEGEMTVDEIFGKAVLADQKTDRIGARRLYEKTIEQDPDHVGALRSGAVLEFESGHYEEAASRLEGALEADEGDGLSWFFLGAVRLKQGSATEALLCGEKAAALSPGSSAGPDLMGRALMLLGRREEATQAFEEAIDRNPHDARAMDHLLLSYYARGLWESARPILRARLDKEPTALLPHVLEFFVSRPEANAIPVEDWGFLGEKDFEVLETALVFAEVGMVWEALRLTMPIVTLTEDRRTLHQSPLNLYAGIHFAHQLGRADVSEFIQLGSSDWKVYGHFPSRPVEESILRSAIDLKPDDANAHLHLGNLLAGLGRTEEAVAHWEEAARLDGSLSVPFRNLALYAWKKERDPESAVAHLEKARKANPTDQTVLRDLAEVLMEDGETDDAIDLIEGFPVKKVQRNDVIEILAKAYNEEKRYDDTIDLLSQSTFSNWESRKVSHDVWVRAHIERGKNRFEEERYGDALEDFKSALSYPENLGVGRPAEPKEAEALYWKGKALEALGKKEEARVAWREGAGGASADGAQDEYREKCRREIEPS